MPYGLLNSSLGSARDCLTIRLALDSSALSSTLDSTVGSSLILASAARCSAQQRPMGQRLTWRSTARRLALRSAAQRLARRTVAFWLLGAQLGARWLDEWISNQQLGAWLRTRLLSTRLVAQWHGGLGTRLSARGLSNWIIAR